LLEKIRKGLTDIVKNNGLESEEIVIRAATLSPEEAIGNPEDRDYPIIKGKERLMQAVFRGESGQAFTDMHGNFSGRLADILNMDLADNFQRAVFISSLNAVMRYLKLAEQTVHCKDNEPPQCSLKLVDFIKQNYNNPKIAFVGCQPRMIQALTREFQLKVTDLDKDNIGQEKFGVLIQGAEDTRANLDWCDIALVTGTTVVNDTFEQFLIAKPVIFYGVTISGVARMLVLNHFCPCGH